MNFILYLISNLTISHIPVTLKYSDFTILCSKDETHMEKFQTHLLIMVINSIDVILKFIHIWANI